MDDVESSGVISRTSLGGPPAALIGSGQDRARLGELFDAEFPGLFGFLLARCGSRSTAEDVAAETFVEAARVAKQGRIAEITRPWLFMVARRRLIDHWRADERHRRRLERLRLRRDDGPSIKDLEDERLLAALQSLPTRQRAALTLRYLDEYSVTEIAESLDVTYRAAESLLSRARSNFTKIYGDLNART